MTDTNADPRRPFATTRRALALLALAFLLAIGAWLALVISMGRPDATTNAVFIAIRTDAYTPHCHTSFTHGTLVANATTGTAIVEDESGRLLPIRWPEGFTARRAGTQIEILNASGNVIAVTGRRYQFLGGYGEDGWRGCDGVNPPLWGPEGPP